MLSGPVSYSVGPPVASPLTAAMFVKRKLFFYALAPGKGLTAPKAQNTTATLPADIGNSVRTTVVYNGAGETIHKEVPAGCVPEYGCRMVQNISTNLVDWDDRGTATMVDNGDETFSVSGLGASEGNDLYELLSEGDVANRDFRLSVRLKGTAGETIYLKIKRNSGGGDVAAAQTVILSGNWQRFSPPVFSGLASNANLRLIIHGGLSGTPATACDLKDVQAEEVTGFTNQNPGEYVSVGVLSTPYHGYGADGINFYNTKNGNTVSSGIVTEAAGDAIPDATMLGIFMEPEATNNVTRPRDLSHADWVKTNITAAQDAVGIDGATKASTLTATAGNGTCFFTDAIGSAEYTTSFFVKRKTGTGTIEITDNGGSNYTDITSSINGTTFTRVAVTRTQANPSVGFRIVTDTDAIEVDAAQSEAGSFPTSPILTGNETRASSQELTYPIANVPGPTGAQEFSFECEWTPIAYGETDIDTDAGIVSLADSAETDLLVLENTGAIESNDGTNTNSDAIAWLAGTTYRIRITASAIANQIGLMVAGGTDDTAAFDGTFTVSDAIRFCKDSLGGNCIKNVRFWNYDKGDAWRQAA